MEKKIIIIVSVIVIIIVVVLLLFVILPLAGFPVIPVLRTYASKNIS